MTLLLLWHSGYIIPTTLLEFLRPKSPNLSNSLVHCSSSFIRRRQNRESVSYSTVQLLNCSPSGVPRTTLSTLLLAPHFSPLSPFSLSASPPLSADLLYPIYPYNIIRPIMPKTAQKPSSFGILCSIPLHSLPRD